MTFRQNVTPFHFDVDVLWLFYIALLNLCFRSNTSDTVSVVNYTVSIEESKKCVIEAASLSISDVAELGVHTINIKPDANPLSEFWQGM